MMWRIAIFATGLVVAAQAQDRAGEANASYATGTLDYVNVGENDCVAGAEVPVRFVAKDVELEITIQDQTIIKRERKGVDIFEIEMQNPDFENPPNFPDSGFLLDVDVTFCISPFAVIESSGSWKVWHKSGEEDLVATGKLPSDDPAAFGIGPIKGGFLLYRGGSSYLSRLSYRDENPDRKQLSVSAHGLNFPRLRKANGSLLYIANARVRIIAGPEDNLGKESND